VLTAVDEAPKLKSPQLLIFLLLLFFPLPSSVFEESSNLSFWVLRTIERFDFLAYDADDALLNYGCDKDEAARAESDKPTR
jgi:hypothetical protein